MTHFKDRLEMAMRHRNVCRTELAKELGCTPAALGALLRGRSGQMSGDNLVRTARYCGVSAYWLGTGDGPMTEQYSGDALEIARRIDNLTGQERRRALTLCKLALFCPLPEDLTL